jgi:glycerophosphoryl diester phosphodiesterase
VADSSSVIVIAHRGASGERPEHTLESYQRAVEQGADYIEPDGETMTGWFTEDFTLAEIKTLRARERLPALRPANCAYDGRFSVPTFEEIMQLAQRANRARSGKSRIGVYPETKHPAHFQRLDLAQERPVLETLERHGYAERGSPVFIQSFDPNNLRQLRGMTALPLVQLLEYEIGDVSQIAQYANCIGIAKDLTTPASVAKAHDQGLKVHAWTFRAENEFLPDDLKIGKSPAAHGNLRGEIARYLALGIHGFFTDFPAIGVAVRDAWAAQAREKRPPG